MRIEFVRGHMVDRHGRLHKAWRVLVNGEVVLDCLTDRDVSELTVFDIMAELINMKGE